MENTKNDQRLQDLKYLNKDYKISESIGSGSYGEVFRVRHRVTKRVYAAKYLRDFMSSKTLSLSVTRELHILKELSKMKNSNIFTTKLHELILGGKDDTFNSIFLVMDYMPYDLRKLMQNADLNFDDEHAIAILYNILCGMNFLHTANVIHRDLKPANILVDNSCVIKICDFGISRTYERIPFEQDSVMNTETINPDSGSSSRKRPSRKMSTTVMTRWYRAPEVILLEPYDTKIDIWSVGCVFGELLKFTGNYQNAFPADKTR